MLQYLNSPAFNEAKQFKKPSKSFDVQFSEMCLELKRKFYVLHLRDD